MSNDVTVTFSAQDQGVIAYLNQQNAAILKNQEKLIKLGEAGKKAGQQTKQGAQESLTSYDQLATRLTTMAAGYLSVGRAIAFVTDAQRKQIEESDRAAVTLDSLRRAMQVATNLDGPAAAKMSQSIEMEAVAAGVKNQQAYETAIQMASSGFSNEQIQQGGLREFLRIQSAQRLAGKVSDAQSVVASTTQLLQAQGRDVSAANVSQIGAAVQSLKETPLVFSDLTYLAKEQAGLKQAGLTNEESLTAFSELRKTFAASEAGTGLRAVSLRLATAGGAKDRTEALGKLGLTPADVDMVGESFVDVLDRMKKAIAKIPAEERNATLKTIFEDTGIAPAMALMNGRQNIIDYQAGLQNPAMFNRDVAIAQGGLEAAKNRIESSTEVSDAGRPGAGRYGVTKAAVSSYLKENGSAPYFTFLAETIFDLASVAGASPEGSARAVFAGAPQSKVENAMIDILSRVDSSMAEQNKLMREQNKLLEDRKTPPVNNGIRNPGAPPRPRPSSALSKS